MATVPTGGERYFARPPVQVPHSVLDRAAEISPVRRGTAARLAAEPVRLRQDRRRLPPGCRPSTRAVLSIPMLRAGLLGPLRPLSRTELVEFRRTVDAATWVRNVNVDASIPHKGTSKNGHRSSGIPDLPTNDSGLFSVRFCAVHPKDADDCRLLQFFEVPISSTAFFMAAAAESLLRDNAPAESVPVMM
jgi:hypothetical protein